MTTPGSSNTELLASTEIHSLANNEPPTPMETGLDRVGPSQEAKTYIHLQQQQQKPALLTEGLTLTDCKSHVTRRQSNVPSVCTTNTEQVTAPAGSILDENRTNSGFAVVIRNNLADVDSELVEEERDSNARQETADAEKALTVSGTSRGFANTMRGVLLDSNLKNRQEKVALDCTSSTEQTPSTTEKAVEEDLTSRGLACSVALGEPLTEKQTTAAMDEHTFTQTQRQTRAAVENPKEDSRTKQTASSSSGTVGEADLVEQDNGPDSTATYSAATSKADTPSTGKERIDIQLHCPVCEAVNDFYVCEGALGGNIEAGERVKLHAGAVPMHCELCSASFKTCFGVVRPTRDTATVRQTCRKSKQSGEEGAEKPYRCPHCDKSFNYRYSFKVHMQAHTGEKPLKCSECGATFRRPHRLYEHLKSSHSDSVTLVKCLHCPKHFTAPEALKEHTLLHTLERPYTCMYCSSAFKTRFDRDRHALIHTGERPYKCSQCSAAFKRPFSLTQHIRSKHTEAGKKPPRQPSLKPRKKYTRRNDTRERPFKCLECDCAYMTAQKLKDHTILKHNAVAVKKTYSCHMCDSVFRKISDLNVHIKSHRGWSDTQPAVLI